MSLLYLKHNNDLITKKKKKNDQEIGAHFSQTSSPPLHFTYNFNITPLCVRIKPTAHFPLSACLHRGSHPDSPGQPCLWQDVGPQLCCPVEIRYPLDRRPPSLHGGTTGPGQEYSPPQPKRPSDFIAETLANTIPAESTTVTLLSQLVKGLVTISHDLSGVSQKLATISQENEAIREELHDISSQLANLPTPHDQNPPQALADLQASIRDLSHGVSTPAPVPLQAPATMSVEHPSFCCPSPRPL